MESHTDPKERIKATIKATLLEYNSVEEAAEAASERLVASNDVSVLPAVPDRDIKPVRHVSYDEEPSTSISADTDLITADELTDAVADPHSIEYPWSPAPIDSLPKQLQVVSETDEEPLPATLMQCRPDRNIYLMFNDFEIETEDDDLVVVLWANNDVTGAIRYIDGAVDDPTAAFVDVMAKGAESGMTHGADLDAALEVLEWFESRDSAGTVESECEGAESSGPIGDHGCSKTHQSMDSLIRCTSCNTGQASWKEHFESVMDSMEKSDFDEPDPEDELMDRDQHDSMVPVSIGGHGGGKTQHINDLFFCANCDNEPPSWLERFESVMDSMAEPDFDEPDPEDELMEIMHQRMRPDPWGDDPVADVAEVYDIEDTRSIRLKEMVRERIPGPMPSNVSEHLNVNELAFCCEVADVPVNFHPKGYNQLDGYDSRSDAYARLCDALDVDRSSDDAYLFKELAAKWLLLYAEQYGTDPASVDASATPPTDMQSGDTEQEDTRDAVLHRIADGLDAGLGELNSSKLRYYELVTAAECLGCDIKTPRNDYTGRNKDTKADILQKIRATTGAELETYDTSPEHQSSSTQLSKDGADELESLLEANGCL